MDASGGTIAAEEIAVYEQSLDEARHLDSGSWQIPAVGITVGGALLLASYSELGASQAGVRAILLGIGAVFSFVMGLALVKNRLFIMALTISASQIETKWENQGLLLTSIPRTTADILARYGSNPLLATVPLRRLHRVSVNNALIWAMFGLGVLLAFLALWNARTLM